jgi:tetratricopeptide (TPR) repeat protein
MYRSLASAAAIAAMLTLSFRAAANPPFVATPEDPPKPAATGTPYDDTPPKPLTWQEKLKRDGLFREGKAFITQEKWKEASGKLWEAVRIRPDAEILLWLGYAEEQQGKLVAAKRFYTQARAEATSAKQPDMLQRATQALAELEKNLPRIKLKLLEATPVMVYVDEAVVKYLVDGVELDPGTHTLQITAHQRKDFRTQVVIRMGETQTIEVALPSTAPPPAPPPEPPPPGCACRTAGEGPERAACALAFGALALLYQRRARRR